MTMLMMMMMMLITTVMINMMKICLQIHKWREGRTDEGERPRTYDKFYQVFLRNARNIRLYQVLLEMQKMLISTRYL